MSEAYKKYEEPHDCRESGVPLGGLGAGAVELGRDGRFRNITINNNRTADTRIPIARASFLAVRIASGEHRYVRILQQSLSDRGGAAGAAEPARLRKEAFTWRGLYPMVHYVLRGGACPLEVAWSAFAPIIPFDHEASTLPALFLSVRFANRTKQRQDVSAVFNWENLCGHTRLQCPVRSASVTPLYVEEREETVPLRGKQGKEKRNGGQTGEGDEEAVCANALVFGSPERASTNADGHYCLAAKRQRDARFSVLAWDHECSDERQRFWNAFRETGDLPRAASVWGKQRSGAVCCAFSLPPRHERRVDFVLSWYCPRFEVKGVDQGNGYTNRFKDAVEVAAHALKNLTYYQTSVSDWQRRVESSSLPGWLDSLVINSLSVFSTNSLFTRDGCFAMFDSPADPRTARLDTWTYSSLGFLLWFPRFEQAVMTQYAGTELPEAPDLLCGSLGALCLHDPEFSAGGTAQQDRCAQFALSACQDYFFTGNLARIQALFPRLRRAMASVQARDRDGDGLPEPEGTALTYDGLAVQGLTSYSSGLWVAALCAYAKLAHSQGKDGEARRYQSAFRKAAASFERLFWNDRLGYYLLGRDPKRSVSEEAPQHLACHLGQLAGQWYADFLGLGSLFAPVRVARALDALERYNLRAQGFAGAVMPIGLSRGEDPDPEVLSPAARLSWPAHTMAHVACLQIRRGRAGAALRVLGQCAWAMDADSGLTFNRPLTWDLDHNTVGVSSRERHLAWLSAWHVLYALEGLGLNVPESRLCVAPHLPEGVQRLSAPLFTPSCLGWLRFREDREGGYVQEVGISFDSPISLREIELRIPEAIHAASVHCETADGTVEVTHLLGSGALGKTGTVPSERAPSETGLSQVLLVRPRTPIIGLRALGLTVVGRERV